MTESPLMDLGVAVPIFSLGDDPITCLNKAMAFLTAIGSSRFPSTNNQLRTSSNTRNQATIQDGRVTVQQVQGRQGQIYFGTCYKSNATSSEENNASGQARTEDLDTYDSDCDDISNAKAVLMVNISNYGSDVISKVPHSETCLNDIENQRKEIVDIAAQKLSGNTIVPRMFKLDLVPLAPKLLQNREAYIDYLKHTQEQANILQGIVKQAKAKQPLDNAAKKVVVTPKTMSRKLGLKCSTSIRESKPTGNKKNDRISQTPSRNMKCNISHFQYIQMMDYALWEVIKNDATFPKIQVMEGVTTVMPITSVVDKAQRKLKASKFGEPIRAIRNKADLDTMSIDDLYNNLKVYEPEVKGMSSSNSNTQNMHSINVAFSINIDNLSDAIICAFLASQPNSPQLAHKDLEQIHRDGIEEMDLRWKMDMLTMRTRRDCRAPINQDNKYKESTRRNVLVETPTFIALVSCDGLGGYDWSDQEDEGPNYALMAYTFSSLYTVS
uniref:Uncharacterized protein n=1 Tax=Tanacetum cinerariifolium TaxID=118510 RepID=A0A6L2NBF3_TANCI|nr:hypothetical protein [Tanacetum cinerariifolium]